MNGPACAAAAWKAPGILRIGSHLIVWTCIWAPALLVLVRGWSPIGDFAALEIRAFDTFSSHFPLIGMYSTSSTSGHAEFDPGPLMSWLLAVPVHLDPSHGLIWGSAVLWATTLSVAIETLWSSPHKAGCALIALAAVVLLWATPFVLENLAWNADFPLPFFILAIILAFLVGSGSFRRWPLLVFAASVAGQSHLLFLIPSLALVVAGPLVGIIGGVRPERGRWLVAGFGVGLLCWLAPLIQGLGKKGNVGALAHSPDRPLLGWGYGIRLVGDSADPFPIWLHRAPLRFLPDMVFAYSHSPASGWATVVVLGAVCAVAARCRSRSLSILSAVALVTCLGLAASFAIIPVANLYVVGYLLPVLWIQGLLLWIVAAWSVSAVFAALSRKVGPAHRRWGSAPFDHERGRRPAVQVGASVGALAVGAFFVVGMTGLGSADANFGTNWSRDEAHQVTAVTALVEHRVRKGPVDVEVEIPRDGPVELIAVSEGVGSRLLTDGWRPGLPALSVPFSALPPRAGSAEIAVRVEYGIATAPPSMQASAPGANQRHVVGMGVIRAKKYAPSHDER